MDSKTTFPFEALPEDDPRRKLAKVVEDLEPEFAKREITVFVHTVDMDDTVKITSNADKGFLLIALEDFCRKLRAELQIPGERLRVKKRLDDVN